MPLFPSTSRDIRKSQKTAESTDGWEANTQVAARSPGHCWHRYHSRTRGSVTADDKVARPIRWCRPLPFSDRDAGRAGDLRDLRKEVMFSTLFIGMDVSQAQHVLRVMTSEGHVGARERVPIDQRWIDPLIHGMAYLRYYLNEATDRVRVRGAEFEAFYIRNDRDATPHPHKRAPMLTARKRTVVIYGLLTRGQLYDGRRFRP